jgi:hypothetical protein
MFGDNKYLLIYRPESLNTNLKKRFKNQEKENVPPKTKKRQKDSKIEKMEKLLKLTNYKME